MVRMKKRNVKEIEKKNKMDETLMKKTHNKKGLK